MKMTPEKRYFLLNQNIWDIYPEKKLFRKF